MPKGTKVEKCYTKLRRKGMSKGKSARICQASTGLSLKTGKPPKSKQRRKRNGKKKKANKSRRKA